MRKFKSLGLGLLFLAQTSSAADLASVKACVQAGYQKLTNRHGIVAAVLNSKSKEVMTFGAAKEDQIFEIGSITKTFTGNLLAQSVLEGSVQLSDAIPKQYQKSTTPITYQQLTTHTSGIIPGVFPKFQMVDPLKPYDGVTIPVFKELYNKTDLAAQPGTQWAYSNIGVSLLGLVLSEQAGMSYEKLVQERIFKSLGLNETYFEVPSDKLDRFPLGYMTSSEGETQQVPHWDLYKTAIDPAGGIRSNIHDMVKYARANLVPSSSSLEKSIELSHKPLYYIDAQKKSIGFNWIVDPEKDLIWHNGETYGFNSILAISQKQGVAVIAMTDTTVQTKTGFDTGLQDVVFECLK